MKKLIAVSLVVMAMLMLAACGNKAATVPSTAATEPETQVQETQAAETTVQATEPAAEPEYAGVYMCTKSEEIGGTITEKKSYIVLNADHTGYVIAQDVGALTWTETQLTEEIGVTYNIALTQENGTVNLLVYNVQDETGAWVASAFEKIEKLPAEMEAMIAEAASFAKPEYAGVYHRTWSEEIGGTVTRMNAYVILNEDHTGYRITQGVGTLTWDENKLMETIGVSYDIALTQENGTVNLLVYEFQDETGAWIPTAFEKIEKLPAEMEEMLTEF